MTSSRRGLPARGPVVGRPAARWLTVVAVLASGLLASAPVRAHATLVLGVIEFAPDPPVSGASVSLRIHLHDPTLADVEDALVFVEFVPGAGAAGGDGSLKTDQLIETAPAIYETEIATPPAGDYLLRVVDRTFRQEEAVAELAVTFGDADIGSLAFVLPPTATGPQNLLSWLAWIIGLPLLAGAVVTFLVLRSGPRSGEERGAGLSDGEAAAPPADDGAAGGAG